MNMEQEQILRAMVRDDMAGLELVPETYIREFRPRARRKVMDLFNTAEKRGVIEAIRTAQSGERIYKLADWLK